MGKKKKESNSKKPGYKKKELKAGSIAWVNQKAREAGMTYGEYVGRSRL